MAAAASASVRWLTLGTICVSVLAPGAVRAQDFHVERLRTEYALNPIGIDERTPRLS
jgi:hypothetical protein